MTQTKLFSRCVLAICLIVIAGCAKKQAAAPPPQPVKVAPAAVRTIRPGVNLSGIVAPLQNVALSSDLQEPADIVSVNEGDHVHRGQLLAQLNTADLQAQLAQAQGHLEQTQYQANLSISQGGDQVLAAQAALSQAQANQQQAQRDLARDEQLLQNGYISAQTVDQQRTLAMVQAKNVLAARATLAQAIENEHANGTETQGLQAANVDQAAAAVQQLRAQIAKATIASPVNGIVVNRNLNPGEYPGTRQIFTLQAISTVYAELNAYGTQITGITPGTAVSLAMPAVPNHTFHGTVYSVLPPSTPSTFGFVVKVVVSNSSGILRPGMSTTGDVDLPTRTGVTVPVTAFLDDTHQTVMTVDGDTAKIAHVNEIIEDPHYAIVTGLAANTQVVINGQTSVTDGQKVVASL